MNIFIKNDQKLNFITIFIIKNKMLIDKYDKIFERSKTIKHCF